MTFSEASDNPIVYLTIVWKLIRTESDLIHIQYEYGVFGKYSLMSFIFFPLWWLSSEITNKTTMITIHEVINADLITGRLKYIKTLYINILNHIIGLSADQLIFLSKLSKSQFKRFNHSGSTFYIPHGTSTSPMSDLSQNEAKQKFGFDRDCFLIAEPGYVSKRKGSDYCLNIAGELTNCEFLIAGGPEDGEDYIFNKVSGACENNIHVTGELDKESFHDVFKAADLIFLPYREQVNRSFINQVKQSGIFNWAMTYEKPVLASDCDYFVSLENEYGCLSTFPLECPGDAADKITKIKKSRNLRDHLQNKAKQFKYDNSLQEVRGRHSKAYMELLNSE